jgi:hypothetical protein
MPNAAFLFITIAIVYAIIGMIMGIMMGVTDSFDYADLHAHINLLGWGSLALYGLVYRAYPEMAKSVLTRIHFWVANLGLILFLAGIYFVITTSNVSLAVVGSLLVLAGMFIFLINFVRHAKL